MCHAPILIGLWFMLSISPVYLCVDGLSDSVNDGQHHGSGGRVRDPHRQEHGRKHEAEHQPRLTHTNLYKIISSIHVDWNMVIFMKLTI